MFLTAIPGLVTDTHTVDAANNVPFPVPLGAIFVESADAGKNRDPNTTPSVRSRGTRRWVFIYNDSGVDIAANKVVARKATEQKFHGRVAPASTPQGLLVGISQNIIPNGSAGWVVCEGVCDVTSDDTTALTVSTSIGMGTGGVAGCVQTVGATASHLGWAVEGVGVSTVATVYAHFPIG